MTHTAQESQPLDAKKCRAEIMESTNDELLFFQSKTAIDTLYHVSDAINDLCQSLPTLMSATPPAQGKELSNHIRLAEKRQSADAVIHT